MKTLNIAYGDNLIALLDNKNYQLSAQSIHNGNGDIIGWNPKTDNIAELFEHLRGSEDFREVTKQELKKVDKHLAKFAKKELKIEKVTLKQYVNYETN